MNKLAATAYLGFLVVGCSVFIAEARPIYAQKENKPCGFCHVRASGGGNRGFRGQFYGANGLSLSNFDEKREASIAGLSPESEGIGTVPTISYAGNVAGPATQQIQLASLRGPVLLIFIDKVDESAKTAVKHLGDVAKAYGTSATVFAVMKGSTEETLKATQELGSRLRVFPDVNFGAVKKFSAVQGLDLAVVAKMGDPVKTFPGFSGPNVDAALKCIAETQAIPYPNVDTAKIGDKVLRGEKLQ